MRLVIQGWRCEGLRCPDMEISLSSFGEKGGISLIQMPNGTGKTTTLNMLRACLTGEAESWKPEDAHRYLKQDLAVESGHFILDLELDGSPLTYEITLNRSGKPAQYRTTSPLFGGVVESRREPTGLTRFFKRKFVDLFVFDGEFADDLLNPTKAEADHAVDALCQLDLVEDVAAFARQNWESVTGARTPQGQSQKQSRVSLLKTKLEEARKHLGEAENRKIETRKKHDALDAEVLAYDSKNRDLMDQKELTDREYHAKKGVRDNALANMFGLIRNPIYVSETAKDALVRLKENLDRAKLPSSASRQFFAEIAEEDTCICGREIGDEQAKEILARAENYLSDDTTAVINSLKDDIKNFVFGDQPSFSELRNSFARTQQDFKSAEMEVERVKKAFRDNSLEERNAKERERDRAAKELELLEKLITKFNTPEANPKDDSNSIPSLEKLLRSAEDELSDIAGKVALGEQTRLIEKLCDEVLESSRDAIKSDLVDKCNDQLAKILVHSPLRLESITGCLKLDKQDGASVGQVLSVGYTFLTSILHRSSHDFPLVVDSPANPIDPDVRTEIGAMIPGLCHQFVALTIASEKLGFVPALESAAEGSFDYITVFRKTDKNTDLLKSASKYKHTETDDGCVVNDKQYFMDFQLDKEPEEAI